MGYTSIRKRKKNIEYDYIISSSYGNDSIALIQYMYEKYGNTMNIAVVYSDTGWCEPSWNERVKIGEKWVLSLGYFPIRTTYTNECGSGMEALIRYYEKFSPTANKWCTDHLKLQPFMNWCKKADPEKNAIVVTGVRREESKARSNHAEFIPNSDKHGGRDLECPLVAVLEAERNELISRTPFKEALPHSSMECNPCVFSNRCDAKHISKNRIKVIFELESDLKEQSGEDKYFFSPKRRMGAKGIHESMRWAESPRGKFVPKEGIETKQLELFLKANEEDEQKFPCTSGMCGI